MTVNGYWGCREEEGGEGLEDKALSPQISKVPGKEAVWTITNKLKRKQEKRGIRAAEGERLCCDE